MNFIGSITFIMSKIHLKTTVIAFSNVITNVFFFVYLKKKLLLSHLFLLYDQLYLLILLGI